MPSSVSAIKGTYLEEAGGDIDRLGQLAPLPRVAEDLPVRVAVIDDEEF